MANDDGGPAFPRTANDDDRNADIYSEVGMSLRDWFAGQALAGDIAGITNTADPKRMASVAYEMADAMLAERSKHAAPQA